MDWQQFLKDFEDNTGQSTEED
ncbi:hypothetical protein KIPB_016138, partial [Kipferlia bialata]|eukprot:g16138.t1